MKQYIEAITDELTGLPVAGAEVWIYDDDNVAAVLYASDGTTEIDNPLTTNEDGEFSFYGPTTELTAVVYYGGRLRRRLRLLVGGGYSVAAAASAAAAEAFAGPTYDNTSEGLADTSVGESFAVYASGVTTVYRHDPGPVATEIRKTLSPDELASSTGGEMVGNQLPAGDNLAIQPVADFINKNVLQPSQFTGSPEEQLVRAIAEGGASRDGGFGQTVQIPRGETVVTETFNIGNRVNLIGVNKRGSRIKADASHAGPYMVTAKNGTSSMFDNHLQSLTLDANSVAGLGCVDSEAWQEGGGLRDVLLQKFTGIGVYLHEMYGGASLTGISDCEIFGDASGCVSGIKLDDGLSTQSFQLAISETSIAGGGAAASSMPRAIDVVKGTTRIYNSHVENCTTGLYLDGSGDHVLIGFTGSNSAGGVTNLVEIASTFTGTLLMLGCRRSGATNFLKDNRTNGFGTITSFDPPTLQIIGTALPMALGAVVAAANINGGGGSATAVGFGVASAVWNDVGDYTVTITTTAKTTADFTVVASTNVGAGNVRCDITGLNSFRFRTFAADGTTPVNVSELKFVVTRVA